MSAAGTPAEQSGSFWSIRRPDGTVAPGWYLMPLRLFLGVTFTFAGLQKLSNPDFFKSSSPVSIHAQLVGAAHGSPIGGLVNQLVHIAPALGAVIAVGEVAIGVGTLVGLWSRVAAVAGMALSFGLFLTISYHSSPYYTGSDIVFFFAWTPVLLAGAAGAPALDTWFAGRRAAGGTAGRPATAGGPELSRRDVMSKGAATGAVAGAVVVLGGATALIGRGAGDASSDAATEPTLGGAPTGTAAPTTTVPGATTAPTTAKPKGTAIGPASQVPVGGSAAFNDPASGDPGLVIQQDAGKFVAFDAICTHAGCTVAYQPSARLIACPCHGSEYSATTGDVLRGPAPSPLRKIPVTEGGDGQLYVDG